MESLWQDHEIAGKDPLNQLVYGSRLIGQNEQLVVWGGGNTSVKREEIDHMGRLKQILRIKSSGVDLKLCREQDFVGLRLDEVRSLFDRTELSDEAMAAFLARCLVDPGGPRPSIETLLHAFLRDNAVVHSHADAVLAIIDSPDAPAILEEIYGTSAVVVPYARSGFALAKDAATRVSESPDAYGMILLHHGLISWGATVQQAYERHIELVTRAERFLKDLPTRSVPSSLRWSEDTRRRLQIKLAPIIRRVCGGGASCILQWNGEERTLQFVDRNDVESLSQKGVATPDHLLQTKRVPVVIPAQPEMTDQQLETLVQERVTMYQDAYEKYYRRYNHDNWPMRDPRPVVAVMPHLGYWAIGQNPQQAQVVHDVYQHTIDIMAQADKCGGYQPITEEQAFAVEYWPLELYKLTLQSNRRELTGRIALVTGAARGIGAAIAQRLAEEGAVVILGDRLEDEVEVVAEKIRSQHGPRSAMGVPLDVTNEETVREAVARAVQSYGGLDILVSNAGIAPTGALVQLTLAEWEGSMRINLTGHFMVTREVVKVMRDQGMGGSLIYIVSKNALVPGKEFGAYSVAKAGELQLGRIAAIEYGRDGIRANMINPDAIWTDLWSPEVRADRAKAYHITEDDLEDYYRHRSLLDQVVTVGDVAEAALFFASDRSCKTTGSILPVDAGIREGFPR